MNLDIFKGDAFALMELVRVINLLPAVPTLIRDRGLFSSEGVTKTEVMVEMDSETLKLVPVAPRGAPGQVANLDRRNVRPFQTVHLPQTVHLMADEVQNLRALGKETDEELAMARLRKKMALARKNLDLTIEFQRMGAIKGLVVDSDGTTPLLDIYQAFGVTQQELDMALDNSGTKVFQKNITLTRMIEDALGGVMHTGALVLCSPEFMDSLTGHEAVEENFLAQEASKLRDDNRRGFKIGSNTYVEYNGRVGNIRFIEAGCAYAVPEGVPDLFSTFYAPAPYLDTVNTEGLPYYASLEPMKHNVGVEVQTQSNPLHLNTRPRSVVRLGLNAAALA